VEVAPDPLGTLAELCHMRGVALQTRDALKILGDQGEELAEPEILR
jgi:hypothetical protein